MQVTQSMQLQPTSELRHTPSATIYTLLDDHIYSSAKVAYPTHTALTESGPRFLTIHYGFKPDTS